MFVYKSGWRPPPQIRPGFGPPPTPEYPSPVQVSAIAFPGRENRMSSNHAGRPSSWVAVSVIFIGFAVGGIALVLGPNWIIFGAGAGIAALGGVIAPLVDIMSDVVLDHAPRWCSDAPPF